MHLRSAVVAIVAISAAMGAKPAHACGGLFCSSINPIPIDQSAERILFEVGADGEVTVSVEIKYSGNPEDFSWILPVPEAPTLGVIPAETLQLLDSASAPTFQAPFPSCFGDDVSFFPFGCGVGGDEAAFGTESFNNADDGVSVEELPRVGPYDDIVVVTSQNPDALVEWLNEHNYLVTDAMRPFINDYVNRGFSFLAVRLASDAGVEDIAPIQYTCPMEFPFIPLSLTAVAAEPEMSFVVMFAGDTRYMSQNFDDVVLDEADIRVDPSTGQMNYFAYVSWQLDEAGGRAFVTEYAGASSTVAGNIVDGQGTPSSRDSEERARSVLSAHPYFTRMYTRLNPVEMSIDPIFGPAPNASDVAQLRDLSDQEIACIDSVPCGDVYCGEGSKCATECGVDESGATTTEDGCTLQETPLSGCRCTGGTAARRISTPTGDSVTCQEEIDLLADAIPAVGVCNGIDCGDGECTAVGGVPLCRCDAGAAAFLTDSSRGGGVDCRPYAETYGPKALLWGHVDDILEERAARDEGSCDAAGGAVAPFALLFVGLVLRRQRRRRARASLST